MDKERIRLAKAKLLREPFNVDSWEVVAKDAQSKKIDDSRKTFESIIENFPTSGKFWKMYIEQEMKSRNFEKVEKLFQRCLVKILNADLWKTYLLYVRETKASLPNYKEKMAQAYDFALEKMGLDLMSYSIWNDYVNFLKSVEATGSYAENQKITAIRKVYQRGIANPMVNIETLWKDYIAFEQSINPLIAEKVMAERSKDYMNARRVAKEYEAMTRGLNKLIPSIPPTGFYEESKQIDLWQKYIAWEKSNPLKVDDTLYVAKRVMFAFEQALLCLAYHPNLWNEAALFLSSTAKVMAEKGDVDSSKLFTDQASSLFERCTSGVLTNCMLVHFAYADFEEQRRKFEKVKEIYEKCLELKQTDITLCYVQYMKFCRRTEGATAARAVFKKAREDPKTGYHVYVAAALMEFYCTKEPKVAVNIFELGMKKFKTSPEFILQYLDFLSHLNDTNNTRVLFERALTSGALTTQQSLKIWHKFLAFESNVGDLASVVKLEKRLAAVLKETPELEISETAQLIERYRFLDLFPCTTEELKSMGYKTQGVDPASEFAFANGTQSSSDDIVYPKPDFSQMIPYKPKAGWTPTNSSELLGIVPLPPLAAELCQILPPPVSFHGPFVIVEKLMDTFMQLNLPNEFPGVVGGKPNGYYVDLFENVRTPDWTLVQRGEADTGLSLKRKLSPGDKSDDEDDYVPSAPVNDIYRLRQQKKIR